MWMRLVRAHGLTSQKVTQVVDRYRQEDLHLIEQAPGFLGIAMGENHVGGSVGSITCWDSEQAMLDSDRLSAEARRRVLSVLDNPEPMLVDRFEVTFNSHLAQLTGSPARRYLRLVRFTGLTAQSLDLASECYREEAQRLVGEVIGIDGLVIGGNYRDGSLAVVCFWDCERSMRDTERLSQQVRDRAAYVAHMREDPLADRWALVDRFEITLASRLERLARVEEKLVSASA